MEVNTPMLCLVALSALVALGGAVDVTTKYGTVRGETLELHTGARVNTFLGVPYAKPPVGDLRFAKPQEPAPWGTFVADKYGHMCPQGGGVFGLTHPGFKDFDEDCLTLSIYSPANDASPGPYAVMVWFHGGGYQGGGHLQYPGHFLSSQGVVVVVANYRLGILGFMTTEDSVVPGNNALHDQNLVLRFVRDNIRAFNGDPNKVTIFGQSAGGSSSGLHLVSPLSKGLFHQAICESGTEMSLWAYTDPLQNPAEFAKDVADQLECPTEPSQALVDCLRTKNASVLVSTDPAPSLGWLAQGFVPTVDGEGGFLPERPIDLRVKGEFSKVRVMTGQTSEDGAPYLLGLVPEASLGGINRTLFLEYMDRMVTLATFWDDDHLIEHVRRACTWQYTPWPAIDDEEANRQQLVQIVTDVGFGFTGDMQLKSQSQYNDSYMYIMGYRSTNATEKFPEWLGVPHNGELPYVWGFPYVKLNPAVRKQNNITDILDWNDEDREMTDFIMPLWANFAKYGNPTPQPATGPIHGRPITLPKFTAADQNYLMIERNTTVEKEYRQKEYAFFQDYLSWMLLSNHTHGPEKSSKKCNAEMKDICHRVSALSRAPERFWQNVRGSSQPEVRRQQAKTSKDTAMHKNEAKIVQNNLKALLRNLHTNLKTKPSMKKEMYARMFNRLQQMKKNH